jgi:hypothetical protein
MLSCYKYGKHCLLDFMGVDLLDEAINSFDTHTE